MPSTLPNNETNDDPSKFNGQQLVPYYVALKGDKTTTGATIDEGSPLTSINGQPVARLGDPVSKCCVCHQYGKIAQGLATHLDGNAPIALGGFIVQCGCPWGANKLIPNTASSVIYLPPNFSPDTVYNFPGWGMPDQGELQYEEMLDGIEVANSVLSLIPGVGILFDIGNLIIDGRNGDVGDCLWDIAGLIPGVSDFADAAKIGSTADKVIHAGRALSKVHGTIDIAKTDAKAEDDTDDDTYTNPYA
jgi:uncharacterized Zn-binding protein involved in type VI secretion